MGDYKDNSRHMFKIIILTDMKKNLNVNIENTYSQIKQIGHTHIDRLIRLGFIKPTVKRNIAVYETYLRYRAKGVPSTDAVVHTCDDFGISDRHVFTIIRKFSKVPQKTF